MGRCRSSRHDNLISLKLIGAGEGIRTPDPNLGKVSLVIRWGIRAHVTARHPFVFSCVLGFVAIRQYPWVSHSAISPAYTLLTFPLCYGNVTGIRFVARIN